MTVGDKIRYHRKQLCLTQTELGERVGVQKNAVSKWECGRVEDIPTSTIKALANLFNVAPSYLIDDDKATEEQKSSAPEEQSLTEDEKWLLHLYRQVPKEHRQVVLAMISAAVEAEQL